MKVIALLLIAALTLMIGVTPVLSDQQNSGRATQEDQCMTVPEIMPETQPASPGTGDVGARSFELLQGTQTAPCPDGAVAMLGK